MQGEYRGDFTRDTFDPAKHFSRVLMQQGRVQLDADWNEQASILLHYLRVLAADLIGPFGGPDGRCGFGLITTEAEIDKLKDVNGTDLDDDRKKLLKEALEKNGFVIGIGHYYVNGLLCENDDYMGVKDQGGYPFPLSLTLEQFEQAKGPYLAYLDVWERHVACLEDNSICEVALGGPDTATRAQVVCHVIVLPPDLSDHSKLYDQSELSKDIDAFNLAVKNNDDNAKKVARLKLDTFAANVRTSLVVLGNASLRARAKVAQAPDDACNISPESRYRGAENQLYRVEIQKDGGAWKENQKTQDNVATFKWSRDNASIAFPILTLAGDNVKLANLGRDSGRGLKIDDWVEIVDDALAFRGQAGPLRQIKALDSDEMTVTLSASVSQSYDETSATHPLLRRWDQQDADGNLTDGALLVKEDTGEDDNHWIALEDGLQIQFAKPTGSGSNSYRAGDYWLIPARVATGDVLWPKQKKSTGEMDTYPSGNPIPAAQSPHGVEHQYAPLAVISFDGAGAIAVTEMRRFFPQFTSA